LALIDGKQCGVLDWLFSECIIPRRKKLIVALPLVTLQLSSDKNDISVPLWRTMAISCSE
jgi:hypothetical protein